MLPNATIGLQCFTDGAHQFCNSLMYSMWLKTLSNRDVFFFILNLLSKASDFAHLCYPKNDISIVKDCSSSTTLGGCFSTKQRHRSWIELIGRWKYDISKNKSVLEKKKQGYKIPTTCKTKYRPAFIRPCRHLYKFDTNSRQL